MEDVCKGCGELYSKCVCDELDAEMNEGKYPDDDPEDGNYPCRSQTCGDHTDHNVGEARCESKVN